MSRPETKMSSAAGRTLSFIIMMMLCACTMPREIEENLPLSVNTDEERRSILSARIDRILSQRQDTTRPGVSLKVIKKGQTLYQRKKGMADLDQKIPIAQDTIFAIASITKPITSVSIFQLQEKGRLSVSDPIGKWIPTLPQDWLGVTIEKLLSHRSLINFETLQVTDGMSNQDVLKAVMKDKAWWPLSRQPVGYGNGGYLLLAEIIERASGLTYPDYLRLHVFNAAQMSSASVHPRSNDYDKRIARNYGVSTMVYGRNDFLYGATGVYASMGDLEKFTEALLSGKLISQESLRLMTADHSQAVVNRNFDSHYGYGWYVPPRSQGGGVFWHNGGADGFQTLLYIDQPKGLVAILLANGGNASVHVLNAVLAVVIQTYSE